MTTEEFRIKELFNVPMHKNKANDIFRVHLYQNTTPWVFCTAGIITACVYFGGWAYLGLLALLPCLFGFIVAIGSAHIVEQYYLYAEEGILTQLKIEILCMKDEGFEEFIKEHGKMSVAEMQKIAENYKQGKKV